MATVLGTLLLCLPSKYQRSVPYFFNKKLGFEPILMFHSKICKEYIFFIAIRYCNFLAKKSILESMIIRLLDTWVDVWGIWGEKNNYTAQWKSFLVLFFSSKELWASHNIVNEIAFWLYKSFWFSVLYKSCKMDLDRLPIDHGFLRLPAASETSFHLRLQQPWMMALSTAVFSSFITWLGSSDLTTAVPDTIMLAPAWWRDKKTPASL